MRIATARALVVLVVSGVLLAAAASQAEPPSAQDIEESLTCQCGCGLTVHSCNHLQCESAIPLRAEVREQMALGKDKPTILKYFADKYGEKILSSPTAKGFNLLAWTMPFVLLGLGGVFIALFVVRWTRHAAVPRRPTDAGPRPTSPYDKIFEQELKSFDE